MTPRLLALLVLCATVAVAPHAAHADDAATRAAKRHFDRGQKLFALGKFDKALDEYQEAFDADPIPDFLFNIGQCYRNLGEIDRAIFSYKRFLKLEPDAPNRDAVERLIDELEDKKARRDSERMFEQEHPREQEPTPKKHEASSAFYEKWWFWTGVAVVGVAGGVGIYEGTKGGPPGTDLGNIVFGK